jgi:hypothetical protein
LPVSPFAGFAQIDQGTGVSGRIGNNISLKRVTLNLIFYPLPYNATTNARPRPQEVKMWLLYDKESPTSIPQIGNDFIDLNNSSIALSGTLIDMMSSVNKERYIVKYSKVFKLGYSSYEGATSDSNNSQEFANNDFKLNQKFSKDITKYLVQNVKYNDTNADPTSRGLFILFESVNADNGPNENNLQVQNHVSMVVNTVYEDK